MSDLRRLDGRVRCRDGQIDTIVVRASVDRPLISGNRPFTPVLLLFFATSLLLPQILDSARPIRVNAEHEALSRYDRGHHLNDEHKAGENFEAEVEHDWSAIVYVGKFT